MASTIFTSSSNAESVLHKVTEFINIKKEEEALDIIYSFTVSNRAKQWSREFERLMFHLIDLSLLYEKHSFIQEGLEFFREISFAHNSDSFKQVCEYYVQKLRNDLDDCLKVISEKDELYYEMNNKYDTQAFLFNALDDKEGRVKEKLKKSWRNLCFGFYNIIDLTFSNKKLLGAYIQFSKEFVDLIEAHQQSGDFTKLISHLISKQQKLQKSTSGVNILKNPEINYELFQQRKNQLEVSQRMNLIQESFSILESINYLLFCKKALNKDLSFYYSNLAEILKKGEFRFFEVIALQNEFSHLVKAKADQDSLKGLAEKIVLATLSVTSKSEEFYLSENLLEKYQFLFPNTTLEVNLESLFKSIDQMNLTEFCNQDIKDLYFACTGRYSIYDFSDHIIQGLKNLPEHFSYYAPLIKQNSILIILKLLAKYFTNLSFSELQEFTQFTEFIKVKHFILKSIFDKSLNVILNYKDELIEFPQNKINANQIQKFSEKLKNSKKNLMLGLISLQKKQSLSNADIQKEFVDYIKYLTSDRIQEQQQKIMADREFLQSKIKIIKPLEVSEEEIRKQQRLKEIEERNQLIERKMLNEKKKIIQDLLKLDSNVKILDKPLRLYTDEEIVQINIDFFVNIEDQIQREKEQKTKNRIEKNFNVYDYYKREELKKYFSNLVAKRSENQVDLKDLEVQKLELEQKREEQRKDLLIAKAFIEDYQIKLSDQAQEEFESDEREFIQQLQEQFAEDVLKDTREKFRKYQAAQREQQMKNPGQKRRGFTGVQQNTSTFQPKHNTELYRSNAKEPEQPAPTTLARRGENFKQSDKLQRSQKTAPTLQRGTQQMGTLKRNANPTPLSRNTQPTRTLTRNTQQQNTLQRGTIQQKDMKQDEQKKKQAPLSRPGMKLTRQKK